MNLVLKTGILLLWSPQNYQKLESPEHFALMENLIDIMEDDDDVQNIWHNREE